MARSSAKRVVRASKTSAPETSRTAGRQSVLRYGELLRQRIAAPEHSKGQRTRWSLLSAAAEVLEERGYHGLRVTDVNEKAQVSNALFYLYFKNKDEITAEVMTGFLDVLYARSEDAPKPQSIEESMFRANYDYLRQYMANPGLMRCLMQFGDENADFRRVWREADRRWAERVVKRLSREPELTRRDINQLFAEVSALGLMVDAFLRSVYVEKEPATTAYAKAVAPDVASLALFLTRLWVRAIYGREMRWSPGP
jgi:TetR/AcrR family transcriptional regulator, transcriptional repressor for nem operon